MEEQLTKRERLCQRNPGKPIAILDMEEVYRYLDKGHTLKETAEHFRVSENTLRRHHVRHQKYIDALEKSKDRLGLTPPVDLP